MQKYERSSSVVSRVIAGETLIVPIRRGVGELNSIYSLNEVASAIWQAIGEPQSRENIVRQIEADFDGERAQIERDVETFLAEMQSVGLVEGTEAA